ncbi:hypothetical protein G6716_01655 [Polynucleobacter paneuropaeus]|nr:hypothetical protein G6716_01655 [Polynucleobacter paneuropaeus]
MLNNLKKRVSRVINRISSSNTLACIESQITANSILLGKILINQMKASPKARRLSDIEFKVFSQFGDDGIIQYLINQLPEIPHNFIEFGVQDYKESNTRFLAINNNWSGLIFDGSENNIKAIINDHDYWRYDVTAKKEFITAENINSIIEKNGYKGDIGILSIDIDGNDYWVWEAINCISPAVVISEYNSNFGKNSAVTVPYNKKFQRSEAHYSNLYWGASLGALCLLAEKRGYSFVGSNGAGNNAYFIRNDCLGVLSPVSCADGFVRAKFAESRNIHGQLTYLKGVDCINEIAEMPLFDVRSNKTIRAASILEE